MKAKKQHNTILLSIAGFAAVIAIVAVVGLLSHSREEKIIQGQVEVTEYRVSSKVPGRIVRFCVKEGDYVKAGDTLAILEAPEMLAKMRQAQSAEEAAAALERKAQNGTRQEQIHAAWSVLQQAQAGLEIAEKSYNRVQHLYDEGVQTAQMSGEVTKIYPKVGELVGTGSPIMSVAVMDDLWGTFNVREDDLRGITVGSEITAYIPSVGKEMRMTVYYLSDQGSYAVWKATKANGEYDLKTFELKARPVERPEGLRPGMSLVMK